MPPRLVRFALLFVLLSPAVAGGCANMLIDELATELLGGRVQGRVPSEEPAPPAVALYFRGAGEVFSGGLDDVAEELLARGTVAVVLPSLAKVGATAESPHPARLTIGGHSLGAHTAAATAAELHAKAGIVTDELTLIDPVPWPAVVVPPCVRHVTLIRGWSADVELADPISTKIDILDVGDDRPIIGPLVNWTIGHLRITDDARTKAAAIAAALGP